MTPDPTAQAVALPRAAVAAPSISERARPNYKLLGLLALAISSSTPIGLAAALLPYLKSALGLTYAATASSCSWPTCLVPHPAPLRLSRRQDARRWLLPLSVFLSAIGISLIGVARATTPCSPS